MAELFGRYELVRHLAEGGMGEVLLARAADGAGPLVVLKRLLPHLVGDPGAEAQFLEEARLAAQFHHPNLLRVLELGSVHGRWFLAMEYVEGADLRAARGLVVPVGVALKVGADAAAALHHAHRATDADGRPLRVVHCDVSPHNLLVGRDGRVRLIDFGTAKARARGATQLGGGQGKYAYLSPEQALGEEFDHRSDQFSLGVVLWELLTGKRLFEGADDVETLKRVEACEVPAVSTLRPEVPRAAAVALARMLAREPAGRFDDCAAAATALAAAIEQPVGDAEIATWVSTLARDPVPVAVRERERATAPAPMAWDAAVKLLRERASGLEAKQLAAVAEGLRQEPRALGLLAGIVERLRAEHLAPPPTDRDAALQLVWRVLSEAERQTVTQLATLAQPCTVEEAEARVVLRPPAEALPVLDVLEGLVRAQVVTQRGSTAAGSPRFAVGEEMKAFVASIKT